MRFFFKSKKLGYKYPSLNTTKSKYLFFDTCIPFEFGSSPSRKSNRYHLRSSRWCPDISISIRVCPESSLSTNFSSSQKPAISSSSWIGINSNYTQFFRFFYIQFSFGIFESFGAF